MLTRHPHFGRGHRSTHARELLTQVEEEGQTREYNAWEQRERARVATDRAEREKEAREAGERERLKNMSEEERRQWERENPKVIYLLIGCRDHMAAYEPLLLHSCRASSGFNVCASV